MLDQLLGGSRRKALRTFRKSIKVFLSSFFVVVIVLALKKGGKKELKIKMIVKMKKKIRILLFDIKAAARQIEKASVHNVNIDFFF